MTTWSRAASGTPQTVIDAAEQWVPAAPERYRAQVERIVEAIKTFADRVPAGFHLIVTAGGEGHELTAERYRVSLDAYVPLPNVSRPTTVTARIVEEPDPEC